MLGSVGTAHRVEPRRHFARLSLSARRRCETLKGVSFPAAMISIRQRATRDQEGGNCERRELLWCLTTVSVPRARGQLQASLGGGSEAEFSHGGGCRQPLLTTAHDEPEGLLRGVHANLVHTLVRVTLCFSFCFSQQGYGRGRASPESPCTTWSDAGAGSSSQSRHAKSSQLASHHTERKALNLGVHR